VIEVEERRLRPLKQDPLAAVEGVVHHRNGIHDHWRDARSHLVEVLRDDVFRGYRGSVVDLVQDQVLLVQHDVEFFAKDLGVEQVLDAQPHAR